MVQNAKGRWLSNIFNGVISATRTEDEETPEGLFTAVSAIRHRTLAHSMSTYSSSPRILGSRRFFCSTRTGTSLMITSCGAGFISRSVVEFEVRKEVQIRAHPLQDTEVH